MIRDKVLGGKRGQRAAQLKRQMPIHTAACALLLIASVVIPAQACISDPNSDGSAEAAADLELQRSLIGVIAAEADTIVVAHSLPFRTDAPLRDFRVTRIIRGAARLGVRVSYAGGWFPAHMVCRPSDTFRDVGISEGQTYVLYVARGTLIRAALVARPPNYISLEEELRVVNSSAASNKSLERTRNR